MYDIHEINYLSIFTNTERIQDLCLTFPKLTPYLEEIFINIPSILIMLNRYSEASEMLDNIEDILMNFEMEETEAKI
jgi:flagellar biosynthesis protein FliQ